MNFLIIGGAFSIEKSTKFSFSVKKRDIIPPSTTKHNKLHLVALGEFVSEEDARFAMAKARKGRKPWLKRL